MKAMHRLLAASSLVACASSAEARTWEQVYPLQRQQAFTIDEVAAVVCKIAQIEKTEAAE